MSGLFQTHSGDMFELCTKCQIIRLNLHIVHIVHMVHPHLYTEKKGSSDRNVHRLMHKEHILVHMAGLASMMRVGLLVKTIS